MRCKPKFIFSHLLYLIKGDKRWYGFASHSKPNRVPVTATFRISDEIYKTVCISLNSVMGGIHDLAYVYASSITIQTKVVTIETPIGYDRSYVKRTWSTQILISRSILTFGVSKNLPQIVVFQLGFSLSIMPIISRTRASLEVSFLSGRLAMILLSYWILY